MLIELSPLLALLSIALAGFCGVSSLSRPMTAEERKLYDRMMTDHPDWDWRIGVDAVSDIGYEMRRLENEAESCVGTEEDNAKRKEKHERYKRELNEYVNGDLERVEPGMEDKQRVAKQQELRDRADNAHSAYTKGVLSDPAQELARKKQLLAEYGSAADTVWESYGIKVEK